MKPSRRGLAGGLVAACAIAAASGGACGPAAEVQAPRSAPPEEPAAPVALPAAPSPAEPEIERATTVAVLDPTALAALEGRGFTLGKLLLASDDATTEQLARTAFSSVIEALEGDVRATLAEHPTALVSSVLGTRLFDVRWLRSSEMRFELIGVFNRLDRRPFYDGTCGEVRFVYRLAFRKQQGGEEMHGRLPLTVNLVHLVPEEEGCAAEAASWRPPATLADATQIAGWLVDEGALHPERRARWTLKAVETNLQTVRVQSTAHPSMGGHVEYALHVFHPTDAARTAFAPAPMDNVPDVERLARDAALRADLVAYLRQPEVLRSIDQGTLRMPERFLATSARSVAPRGLERPINRPFRQVLREEDLAGLDLGSYRTVRSTRALVRRLDGLSCNGCHQSRSIAGFHHVGMDAAGDPAFRSLVSGASNHLLSDLERRRTYVEAIARGETPDELRPHSERQGNEGGFGASCGLGDPGFAGWTCKEGLRCAALEQAEVGVCLDAAPVGAPCEAGTHVYAGKTPTGDRVAGAMSRLSCGPQLGCSPNISGFPIGACAGRCQDGVTSGACIDFLDIDGFQACLRVGVSEEECAQKFTGERIDRACDAAHPCRQDFVCARTGDADHGACVPPYFVFPLRLDGYPLKK